MSKGSRRERECRDLYRTAGWIAWRPKNGTNPYAGDPDVFEEFDVMAIEPFQGHLHGVQVKANGARGIRAFARRSWVYRNAGIDTIYAVPYDREGWRLIEIDENREKRTRVDEREETCEMGRLVTEWLRDQRADAERN